MKKQPYEYDSCCMLAPPKTEYRLSYADSAELDALVETLYSTAVELSVGVRASASKEFWKLRREIAKEWKIKPWQEIMNGMQTKKESSFSSLAQNLKIMPFNVQHYRFASGKHILRTHAQYRPGLEQPEIREMMFLIAGWRLSFISLRDALETEQMTISKQWIQDMRAQNYELRWVRAKLNPADWYDREIVQYNAAEVLVHNNVVRVRGILPKDPASLDELATLLR